MAELEELKKIKKVYGENFMKLCRNLFPTLLETEGRLFEILTSSFSDNSRTLYEDITSNGLEEEFKSYVYSKIDVEDPEKKIIEKRTPYEILDEAGYELYECSSEKEIQSFKKYYAPGEELCTFNGGRLNRCVVFFAVKKDVENIKRKDYKAPKREDEYGTSVMGIQFNREGLCTVSIKNRYNHTVNNPDATYGNNLDNIAPGLEQSFAELLQERGLKLNNSNVEKFEIPGYVVASDGKYYKYNMEINGTYYCPGNVIIENGTAREIENNGKQMLIDYFILDTEKKTIEVCDENIVDSFVDGLQDIEKIEITKNKEKGNGIRTITIYQKGKEKPAKIEISKDNEIIGYENENITEVRYKFLNSNQSLQELNLPQLPQAGNGFLSSNQSLEELNLPQLTQVGSYFLYSNQSLEELNLPKLTQVGSYFLNRNQSLQKLNLPQLTQVGSSFLNNNHSLQKLNLPQLKQVESEFLFNNQSLQELNLPQLAQAGYNFLYNNQSLQELNLPQLTQVGYNFLYNNQSLQELNLPQLTQVGNNFLNNNKSLQELDLPQLTQVGNNFFKNNQSLQELNLPQLTQSGDNFLYNNQSLQELNLPQLTQAGDNFLCNNQSLQELNLPQLTQVGNDFLNNNQSLQELDLPQLTQAGGNFLFYNQSLQELDLPQLTQAGDNFLFYNQSLQELNLPQLTQVGDNFLCNNQSLQKLNLPQLTQAGDIFLYVNQSLQELNLPKLTQVGYKFLYNNHSLQKLNLPQLTRAGDNFLYNNKSLQELDLPQLTQVGYNFLHNNKLLQKVKIIPNIIKNKVNHNDIAKLDKENELTMAEVSFASKVIAKIREIGKKIFKDKDDNEK